MAAADVLIFLLFVVAAVGAAVFAYLWEKKRSEKLAQAAAALGLTFQRSGAKDIVRAGVLSAMPRGNGHRVRNIVAGRYRDVDVRLFEYVYTTGSGKHQQTHRHEVAYAHLAANFPRLSIVPEHLGHKFFDAVGGDDIDFESDEFSRRYWVRSSDRKFAYDVIHPRMMDHIMAPGWDRWELQGPMLVLWSTRSPLKPEEIRHALDRLLGFYELLPGFRKPSAQGALPVIPTPRAWWN